jgi:hypothetical protein
MAQPPRRSEARKGSKPAAPSKAKKATQPAKGTPDTPREAKGPAAKKAPGRSRKPADKAVPKAAATARKTPQQDAATPAGGRKGKAKPDLLPCGHPASGLAFDKRWPRRMFCSTCRAAWKPGATIGTWEPDTTPDPDPAHQPVAEGPAGAAQRLLSAPTATDDPRPLTPTEQAFVRAYLTNGRNGTAAWLKASPSCKSANAAHVQAHHALRKPTVKALIAKEDARLAAEFNFTRDHALRKFLEVALADPSEITQMRMVSCDSCWPKEKPEDKPPGVVDIEGRAQGEPLWQEPNPDCQHCAGHGIPRVWFADTRSLSPGAKALFQAAKVTRQGIQVELQSRLEALKEAAKIIGAYGLDNEQKGRGAAELMREFFAGLHSKARIQPVKLKPEANKTTPPEPSTGVGGILGSR